MEEMGTKIEGWCIISYTEAGPSLWIETDNTGQTMPEMYEEQMAAQEAVLMDLEDDYQQFRDGEREWGEIHSIVDYNVCRIKIDDEHIIVWEEDGNEIMNTTLEDWRNSL